MGILVRHTARSIKDNLGQLVVILLTVTLVSAVFFVTLTIGGLFTNLQTSLKARLGHGADVSVTGEAFSERKLKQYADSATDIEYYETYLQLAGLFRSTERSESKVVLVEATDVNAFLTRHGQELIVSDSYEYSYGTPEVFIGESFAEENGVKAGDRVSIYVGTFDRYLTLTVSYVFKNYGVFANNVVNNVIVDYRAVDNYGVVNVANIKLVEGADKEKVKAELSEVFPENVVSDSVPIAEVERVVGNNQNLLNVALVFVTAMMIFILFSAYLVVAKKRAREFAVFRAVGADNATIVGAMVAEGLFYGLVGAVVGAMVGRIGMGIAVERVIPNFPDAVRYTAKDYILSILFGGLVSALSALFPILRVVRTSVRGSSVEVRSVGRKKIRLSLLVLSAVLMAVSVVLLIVLPDLSLPFTILLVVASAVFVYSAIPYAIALFSALLSRFRSSRLAGMSVKRNPQGHLLSGLVGFVIVFTFLVVSIVNVIISAITPDNARFLADFAVESVQGDLSAMRDDIVSIYGVDRAEVIFRDIVLSITEPQTGHSKGVDERGVALYSVPYGSAIDFLSQYVTEEAKARFDSVLHPVIVSYDLVGRYGIKVGDEIRMSVEKGLLSDVFTVVGIDYGQTANDRLVIVREDSLRIDGRDYRPTSGVLFIDADESVPNADLYRELRLSAERHSCYIPRFDDWAYATSVGIRGVVHLLRFLQFVVSAVALIGVVNLTVVTLYERRRELNVFFAVGLGKDGYVRLALFESVILSLAGVVVGVGLSLVVNR
ncbi:MAG: FtsX-like permease family protein, partial [Clostridia bacterium]|nr:FtsX-like permease family protein [Clostridia bacterium]